MPADHPETAVADGPVLAAPNRCGCGRLAMARCWLGEHSAARWLVSCNTGGGLPSPTPEAA